MKHWQLIYRTGEEDFETKEVIITETQYLQIQKSLAAGADMVILSNGPTIKRSMIVSINEADLILSEFELQNLGIEEQLDAPVVEVLTQRAGMRPLSREAMGMKMRTSHFEVYERRGWEHLQDCVCKQWEKEREESEANTNNT